MTTSVKPIPGYPDYGASADGRVRVLNGDKRDCRLENLECWP